MTTAIQGQLVEHPRQAQELLTKALPICGFGGGTLITTDDGPIPVDWLRPGDKILTFDGNYEPLRWVGRDCLQCAPEDVPAVHLSVGPPHAGGPLKHTVLAARHRVVLSGWQVELYFGLDALLTEASLLSPTQMAFPAQTAGTTSCSQILLGCPQIIQANGVWVESMQLSNSTVRCLQDEAAEVVDRLDLDLDAHNRPAIGTLYTWEAQQLGLDLATMLAFDHEAPFGP